MLKKKSQKKSDEELIDDYVEYALGAENDKYEYLYKQEFEYRELSNEIV